MKIQGNAPYPARIERGLQIQKGEIKPEKTEKADKPIERQEQRKLQTYNATARKSEVHAEFGKGRNIDKTV